MKSPIGIGTVSFLGPLEQARPLGKEGGPWMLVEGVDQGSHRLFRGLMVHRGTDESALTGPGRSVEVDVFQLVFPGREEPSLQQRCYLDPQGSGALELDVRSREVWARGDAHARPSLELNACHCGKWWCLSWSRGRRCFSFCARRFGVDWVARIIRLSRRWSAYASERRRTADETAHEGAQRQSDDRFERSEALLAAS
jgi:hypothetical protein